MPSLTIWAEKDFDVGTLEKYCQSNRKAAQIVYELWGTNSTALANLASSVEKGVVFGQSPHGGKKLFEEQVGDKVNKALYQYGHSGSSMEVPHVLALHDAIETHDRSFPESISGLKNASERLSQLSSELAKVRHGKSDADQALLAAIMSKSELEKRFTPSAVAAGSSLPTSAVSIIKKCDERIKAAQATQLECGEKIAELREALEEASQSVGEIRAKNLGIIEQIQKTLLQCIAVTANEVLATQLVLGREMTDIVEATAAAADHPAENEIASMNMSMNSSMAYSIEESLQGLSWLETIHRMEPMSRQLFELQNIAEGLAIVKARSADENLTKIQTLENEIKNLKSSIEDLLVGKLPESKQSNVVPTNSSPVMRFSLKLPLDRIWTDFATAENHEEMKKICFFDSRSMSQDTWSLLAYEHVLLGYFDLSTRFPHMLSLHHWNKLKAVVHMCRLKLRIPTVVHESLVEFMLPDSMEIQGEIPPLDLRFRICRLLAVPRPKDEKKIKLYIEWVKRQLEGILFSLRGFQSESTTDKEALWTADHIATVDRMVGLCDAADCVDVAAHGDSLLGVFASITDWLGEKNLVATKIPESPPAKKKSPEKKKRDSSSSQQNYSSASSPIQSRGFLFHIYRTIWSFCVSVDEDNGLHADTPALAGFIQNFLSNRSYAHHGAILGLSLWEKAWDRKQSVPVNLAKQVATILQPGDKFLEKVAGDVFWFGSKEGIDDACRILDIEYLRIGTGSVRDSIAVALSDYRRHLEPDALEYVVSVFLNSAVARVNTGVPSSFWPADIDLVHFSEILCEHFISLTAKSVCDRFGDGTKYLDSVSVARAHANDESRGVWLAEVSTVLWKVVFELTAEMSTFSWDKFGIAKSHSVLWSSELEKKITQIVHVIVSDDDLWTPDRVPPQGQELLYIFQIWERVSRSSHPSELVSLKIARALSCHMDQIERDSLSACMHSGMGGWQATRPPQILHSTKCVDLWTTIFTAVQACIDTSTAQLAMASCAELVVRFTEKYCGNAREGFLIDIAFAHPLFVKTKRTLNRMIRSIDDDTELPDQFRSKKKRKPKLFRKGDGGVNTSLLGGSEDSEGGGDPIKESGSTKDNAFNLIGDNHLFLTDYLMLTAKLSSHDPTGLMVRMHDIAFSLGELDKVRDSLRESIKKEDVKLTRLFKSQSKEALSNLPELPVLSIQKMEAYSDQGVSESRKVLTNTGDLVVQYLGLNLVFVDCREELFEKLYMPGLKDNPLSRILKRFESDKLTAFCLMAPPLWRTTLCRSVLSNFVHAWIYVVADMAARGRVFKDADTGVLNGDLTSLHELADQLGLNTDPDTQELLRMVGCLPVYISGSTATEFKAICEKALAEPFEKSRGTKSRLSTIASSYGRKPVTK